MSKNSLITSDKIYYKLKWHEKADTRKATITFLNLGKLKTISFHDWIPIEKGGEIPWHRIYRFDYQNEVLWDRDKREVNLDLINKENVFSNIEMLEYDNKKWITSNKNPDIIKDEIKIITFNCLMDLYDKHLTNTKNRLPIISDYLEKYDADIICLQEITIKMKEYIMNKNFIKENYYVTSNQPKIYGQMILTKFKPISQNLVTLNGNHMKKYLHLLYKNKNDENIEIYNIHLTSNDQTNSQEKRDNQINQIQNQIRNDKVIILGDFNSEIKFNILNDAWEVLRPNENGYTFDYLENELTNKLTKKFHRLRIDKILLKNIKPISIDLAFEKPINKLFASDHFGLLSSLSLIDTLENNHTYENKTYDKYLLKPGNLLCLILDLKYWKTLNKIRKLYDDNYKKIPPHVTLFQRFVDIDDWYNIKKYLILNDENIKFDKVEVFELSLKYILVLTTSDFNKINNTRSRLAKVLEVNQESKPHITLGKFESKKKALSLVDNVQELINNNPILINLSNVSYMKKINDQYVILDNIQNKNKIPVKKLLTNFINNITNNFEYKLVGSRAFGIKNTDFDIVIIGDIEDKKFNNEFFLLAKMTPYFKYVKLLESKMNSLNIVTYHNKEINLIYTQKLNNKISNIYVKDIINNIEIVKELSKNKFEFFCKCYKSIRKWAKSRYIYGSKYGYLNGISWLYLTLNLFIKKDFTDEQNFVKEFYNFYKNYDWSIPINLNNLKINKQTYSDNIVYISSLTINSTNIVRNITKNTWQVILEQIKIANQNQEIDSLLASKYLKVTIFDDSEFNRIEKKNDISSKIWKLTIKNKIRPYTFWIEKNNTLSYYIGINDISYIDNLVNYFKKFNIVVEIKNKIK